ncbi:MAG: PAS domain S-box protein [Candidatus Thiodiazotropha taylori]
MTSKGANKRFQPPGKSIVGLGAVLLSVFILWTAALSGIQLIAHYEQRQLGDALSTVRDATHAAISQWVEEQHRAAMKLAHSQQVVEATRLLLAASREPEFLIASPVQAELRQRLGPLVDTGEYRGYFIIAPDNINLASSRDANIGTRNPLVDQPDVLARLWAGKPAISRPMRSDVPLRDQDGQLQSHTPTMFIGSHIHDGQGEVIALLTLRIDPQRGPYRLLRQGRLGETGETYLFDANGALLSPSRFDLQPVWASQGPLDKQPQEFLGLAMRDPGHELAAGTAPRESRPDAPLTRAVAAAIAGGTGLSLQGYRDYRGIPVIGAWTWDPILRQGLVTEVDADEAYSSLRQTRWLIYTGTLLASLLIVALVGLMRRSAHKLRTLEARWQQVFATAVDGVVIIDAKGIIQEVNPAIPALFGYAADELVGQNVSMLMPEPHRSTHDGYLRNYLQGAAPCVIGIGREAEAMRKDGSTFPFDLSVSEIVTPAGRQFAGIVHDLSRHKAMEAELEAERQFNVDTLDGLSESIVVLNQQGEIIFVNRPWREFAAANGCTCADAGVGLNYLAVSEVAADDPHAAQVADRLRALLAGRIDSFALQYPCHSPDQQRWFQMRASRFSHRGEQRVAVSHQDISERVAAQTALQDANERLRFLAGVAEGTHNTVIVTDPEGHIIWVNEGFSELTGYRLPEVEGQRPGEILQGPETDPRARHRLAQAIRHGVGIELDILNYDKQRRPYWVHLSVSPIRDEQGRIVQFISIGQDISEQRQLIADLEVARDKAESAAQALEENQAILNLALEGAGAGYWHFDPNTEQVTWDAQSSDIYGMGHEPFHGDFQDWVVRVHPEDLDETAQAFRSALKNPSASGMNLEYRILCPDGEQRYLQVAGGIERDPQGLAVAVYGLHFNLTERWRAQQDLLRAKRSLELLNRDMRMTMQAMGQVGLMLFWIDAGNGRILKVSDVACQRLGLSEAEVLQRSWSDLCPEYSEEAFEGRLAEMREHGFANFETSLETHDQEVFPVEALAIYRSGNAHQPATLITFVTDITARKQAEADLIMSREAAEAASRAKSAFLATMSHEIRTPINGVVGMADLLAESPLNHDQRGMLRSMRASALSLRGIIDDILDFSKIEAGKLALEATTVSPIALVEEVAETLAPQASQKGVALLLDIDPSLDHCYLGDPTRIRQVLFNLGSNAVKFTGNEDDRPGRVTLRVQRLAEPAQQGTRIAFSVIDNGIGISPDAQKELFRPFTQAETSTTRRFGGTGLGLAISRQLAGMMGGDISLRSAPDEGSSFHLQLELPETDCDEQPRLVSWRFNGAAVVLAGLAPELAVDLARLLVAFDAQPLQCGAQDVIATIETTRRSDGPVAVIMAPGLAEAMEHAICEALPDHRACIVLQPRSQSSDGWQHSTVVRSAPLLPSELLRAVAVALGEAGPESVQSPDSIEARPPPPLQQAEAEGRLVLVAEDNQTNRDVFARQLNLLGYAHHVGADGVEALALWQEHRFGLVLTDCQMPKMDGYALAEAIRASEQSSGGHVPVIAVTASALKGEAERCHAAGMDDYLTKPVELRELRRLLDKWLPLNALGTPSQGEAPAEAVAESADGLMSAAGATTTIAAVDPSVLARIVGNDPATINTFLKEFLTQAREIAADIDSAFAARDADAVRAQGHKLKSSAWAVGATRLADLCGDLERVGREDDWSGIERLYRELNPALSAVADYIEAI